MLFFQQFRKQRFPAKVFAQFQVFDDNELYRCMAQLEKEDDSSGYYVMKSDFYFDCERRDPSEWVEKVGYRMAELDRFLPLSSTFNITM